MQKRFLKKALAGYHPYVPGEQPPDGEDWVKLNTNESPLTPTAAPARKSIAEPFGLGVGHVALGNGGDELIEMCFRAFADAGDRVAYSTPTYPLFDPLCRVHEVVASTHPN